MARLQPCDAVDKHQIFVDLPGTVGHRLAEYAAQETQCLCRIGAHGSIQDPGDHRLKIFRIKQALHDFVFAESAGQRGSFCEDATPGCGILVGTWLSTARRLV